MFSLTQLVAPIVGGGLSWLSRDSFPQADGSLELTGLRAPVRVLRDTWGVPHIYAENLPDLLFAQGYVHAQDRLWQMDFSRRLVAGRLAEVAGSLAAPVDRWLRVLGLRRVSEQEPALLDPAALALLEAYTAGVNARIAQGRLPIEFFLLGYRPERWTPVDSLSWSKMVAWALSGNWESELLRAELIERLGAATASELELEDLQPWPDGMSMIMQSFLALSQAEAARLLAGPTLKDGIGSNSWVISGSRTASGKPILANDMHLPLTAPAIWYENHLSAGDLDVTGVSFPGVPLVIAGHNRAVAWGFTAGFADIQDLYIEHIQRTDDGKVLSEDRGGWSEAQVLHEKILVRGAAPLTEEVVITRHGPLINPLIQNFQVQDQLALRWTALEPERTFQALLGINQAGSALQFREALRDWASPVVNVVYADTQGNIGYSLPGQIPIRAKGDGRVPVPGWTGEYEWSRFIPFDELPHEYNPPQGFIATANNRIADVSYPYALGSDYVIADRARRISELILTHAPIDLETVRAMQFDQVSHSARRIAHILGNLSSPDPRIAQIADWMRAWDGRIAIDSPVAAVHEVFMRRVIPLILRDKLGDLTERYAGKGPTPMLAEGSMWGFRSWEWFQRILETPDSPWFDLGAGEQRDDVLRLALAETVEYLEKRSGPDPSEWTWGKIHKVSFGHILGRVKPLQAFFSRGPYPVGGDGTTIWSTYSNLEDRGDGVIAPPFRFIADLSDLDHSLGLLAPGQSGQPGHPHYDDQVSAWFEGRYHPMLFERIEIEQNAKSCLELYPAVRTSG
jgi:penicillin G amidase